jgi:hypothetical protein
MLLSGVLMCGMFVSPPQLAAGAAGLAALPASPGQGPLVSAVALILGQAKYSDRFFVCGMPKLKVLTEKEMIQLLNLIEELKKKSKSPLLN